MWFQIRPLTSLLSALLTIFRGRWFQTVYSLLNRYIIIQIFGRKLVAMLHTRNEQRSLWRFIKTGNTYPSSVRGCDPLEAAPRTLSRSCIYLSSSSASVPGLAAVTPFQLSDWTILVRGRHVRFHGQHSHHIIESQAVVNGFIYTLPHFIRKALFLWGVQAGQQHGLYS